MNGQESEAKQMIQRIVGDADGDGKGVERRGVGSAEEDVSAPDLDEEDEEEESLEESSPAGSTRSKVRQRKK